MRASPQLGQRPAFAAAAITSTHKLGQWPTWQTNPEENPSFTIN